MGIVPWERRVLPGTPSLIMGFEEVLQSAAQRHILAASTIEERGAFVCR